jgi:hypothetical protein
MWVELMDLLSTPCYPPIMGEFKKGWGTPPNPQQEKTLLHLFVNAPFGCAASPSLSKRGLGGVRILRHSSGGSDSRRGEYQVSIFLMIS